MPRALSPNGTLALALIASAPGQIILYPTESGESRVIPFLRPDDEVVRWTPDGRSLLVHHSNQLPDPLERVEIATGRRETLRTLAPPDPAGVLTIVELTVADDLTTYAYTVWRQRSSLFLVEGAR